MGETIVQEDLSVIGDTFICVLGVIGVKNPDTGAWRSNCIDRTSAPTAPDMFPLVTPFPGTIPIDERGRAHMAPYDVVVLFSQGKLTVADFKNATWLYGNLCIPNVDLNGQIVAVVVSENVQDIPDAIAPNR